MEWIHWAISRSNQWSTTGVTKAVVCVLLYAPSHRQDSTYHSLCYTSCGALTGKRNSSIGPPWGIEPTTHRTMNGRSYHGATSRSYTQLEYHWHWYLLFCMQWAVFGSYCITDKTIYRIVLPRLLGDIYCIKPEVCQRCQPGTTPICKIMTKNPYNLQKIPTTCQHHYEAQFWHRMPL